jgi:hypothetical protein
MIQKMGQCEVCEKENIRITLHYGNMWFCDSCWEKEEESTKIHMSPESQQARVDSLISQQNSVSNPVSDALKTARQIDDAIEVRTDLFNAATVAIVEIKKAIDDNSEITNKPYALAETLKNRFLRFQSVVFELNKQIVEATNEQKAIQTYLNSLANQLRAEEREKLRIQDISYRPSPVKSPSVKSITTRQTNKKTKIDKVELRKAAAELGVSEFTLQMLCVSQELSVEQARDKLKASIEQAKA